MKNFGNKLQGTRKQAAGSTYCVRQGEADEANCDLVPKFKRQIPQFRLYVYVSPAQPH